MLQKWEKCNIMSLCVQNFNLTEGFFMEKVNNVLKRYRKLRGISLEELAVRSGVPKSTLNRYENNNNQKGE